MRLTIMAIAVACAAAPAAEAQRHGVSRDEAGVRAAILRWNRIAIDASGLDHTGPAPGEQRKHGEQLGPGRSSRAMAIVHIAMFEALNASEGRYPTYIGLAPFDGRVFPAAAIARAAHDALAVMYPAQAAAFHSWLQEDLGAMPGGGSRREGELLGMLAARLTVSMRMADGADYVEPTIGNGHAISQQPGHWRPDPLGQSMVALGAHWGDVRPFVLSSTTQFRTLPPPPMTSEAYAEAFEEVRRFGGDGNVTPTLRTEEETRIGIYWAYDGTPSLCAPPRLYNQVATTVANERHVPALELARLLALVNVAMSDASVAIWESKYYYDVWRPVTGIREADEGAGPTGLGDGNVQTRGDPRFTPLGAPASNLRDPNFTPPFPSYPSGHAGFGGALFEILRRFFGRDDIPFTFVSDEYDGRTRGNDGQTRPLWPRHFLSFSQAEEENGQSRIYLGIHWAFDKTAGIEQGRQVAAYVFERLYPPPRE